MEVWQMVLVALGTFISGVAGTYLLLRKGMVQVREKEAAIDERRRKSVAAIDERRQKTALEEFRQLHVVTTQELAENKAEMQKMREEHAAEIAECRKDHSECREEKARMSERMDSYEDALHSAGIKFRPYKRASPTRVSRDNEQTGGE